MDIAEGKRMIDQEKLLVWLRNHPIYTIGLHGQVRTGLPTGEYLAQEIEDGFLERNEYRPIGVPYVMR